MVHATTTICLHQELRMPRRILLAGLVALAFAFSEARTWSRPTGRCFARTPTIVDCLAGRFAEYWQASGGLPVFGYQITPPYDAATPNGLVIAQMVERNWLE